jgi:hypothetical protein
LAEILYNIGMFKQKNTEEEIQWAISELKKNPKFATWEQAVKLLDTFKDFSDSVVKKIVEDKKREN